MQTTGLCSAFGSMQLAARPRTQLSFKTAVAGQQLAATQRRSVVPTAAARLVIEAKQNSLKRQRTSETSRVYNKSRKSEIATRMKKVLTALEAYKASPPASEADMAPVQDMINKAYQVIDKAVGSGTLHLNTAARRKARLAMARQRVLIAAGLYTPVAAAQ